jgi:hypothetical protein
VSIAGSSSVVVEVIMAKYFFHLWAVAVVVAMAIAALATLTALSALAKAK